jgi:hypothetical protein
MRLGGPHHHEKQDGYQNLVEEAPVVVLDMLVKKGL